MNHKCLNPRIVEDRTLAFSLNPEASTIAFVTSVKLAILYFIVILSLYYFFGGMTYYIISTSQKISERTKTLQKRFQWAMIMEVWRLIDVQFSISILGNSLHGISNNSRHMFNRYFHIRRLPTRCYQIEWLIEFLIIRFSKLYSLGDERTWELWMLNITTIQWFIQDGFLWPFHIK